MGLSIFLVGLFLLLLPSQESQADTLVEMAQGAGYTVTDAQTPKASVAIDAASGQILWEENIDTSWNPADLVKLMTVYLTYEAMANNQLSLSQTVTASEDDQAIAQLINLHSNNIIAGNSYTISELLDLILVPSSDAATVMLANILSDNDPTAFVATMNQKAKELGMNNTTFYTPVGNTADDFDGYYTADPATIYSENQSTARDLAILSYYSLKDYPDMLKVSQQSSITLQKDTTFEETLVNTNLSLPTGTIAYPGTVGLLTGGNQSAGYHYIGVAEKANLQVIEVILGARADNTQTALEAPHAFGNGLFDYVFETYEYTQVLAKGEYTINNTNVVTTEDFYGILAKDSEASFSLEGEDLLLDNGLYPISVTIPSPSLPLDSASVEVIEEPVVTNGQTPVVEYIVCGLIALAGISMVATAIFTEKARRGRRHRDSGSCRFLLALGIITLLFAGVFAYTTWNFGNWLTFLKQIAQLL